MKQNVLMHITGKQHYGGQEPDTIQLTTEGTMENRNGVWELCYEESDLTGLAGVTTTFRVEEDCVTLSRTGRLDSRMVFRVGVAHESLYQMEFGALLMTVCANKIESRLDASGGWVDLVYTIEIEQAAAGVVEYHLEINPCN